MPSRRRSRFWTFVAAGSLMLASAASAQRSRTPATGTSPQWVEYGPSKATIPDGAVSTETGAQKSATPVYVCRVALSRALALPGSMIGKQCQAVALDGRTVTVETTFEILTGDKRLQWQAAGTGERTAPATAISAGGIGARAQYVCLAHPERGADPSPRIGRVDLQGRRCAYIEKGTAVKFSTDFDFLVERETRSRTGDGRVFEQRGQRQIACDPGAATPSIVSLPANGGWSSEITVRYPGKETLVTEVVQDECLLGASATDAAPDAQPGRGQAFPARTVELKQECYASSFGKYRVAADGRVYFLHWRWADDPSCQGWVEVSVPPSRGRKAVVSLPMTTADGPIDRIDSTRTAQPDWCNVSCSPDVVITSVGSDWYSVALNRLPTGSEVTKVTQDECRDGRQTATKESVTTVKLLKKWFTTSGRIYSIYFECLGDPYSVAVLVNTSGADQTKLKPRTEYEVTVQPIPIDDECCEPVPGFISELAYDSRNPNQMTDVHFSTRSESEILSIHQDECVGPDAFDARFTPAGGPIEVRNDREERGDGRIYRIEYECGLPAQTRHADVWVAKDRSKVDSGKRYDSTRLSDVGTYPECDRTPPGPVTCKIKRVDAAEAPVADYCLFGDWGQEVSLAVLVDATDDVTPAASLVKTVVGVTSDERTTAGTTAGSDAPDATLKSGNTVGLRDEAVASSDGRVYHVEVTATDAAGNVGEGRCRVLVPRDQAILDCSAVRDSRPPEYDATQRN